MYRPVCAALVSVIVAVFIAGCGRSEKTTPPLGRATWQQGAAVTYCLTVQIPPAYVQKEMELINLSGVSKWDQQITGYKSMLRDESMRQFPDYRASVYAKLADAYLAKSNGKDIGSYLMLVSLALEQAESEDLKRDLLGQMAAVSAALENPEIGNYWRDAQARHNASGKHR